MSALPAFPAGPLRRGLLEGINVLLAGASSAATESGLAAAVAGECAALGASVATCAADLGHAEGEALEGAVAAAVAELSGIDLLVVDGAGSFAAGLARDGSAHTALRTCMDGAWSVTHATVNQAFLQLSEPRGRVVFLAPSPAAGEYASAACAGLENLARTLSTEWARYQITTVTIAPGAATPADEVAALVAYLASPAGAYFSGCLLDLVSPGGPVGGPPGRDPLSPSSLRTSRR